jgi:hypothetical protein
VPIGSTTRSRTIAAPCGAALLADRTAPADVLGARSLKPLRGADARARVHAHVQQAVLQETETTRRGSSSWGENGIEQHHCPAMSWRCNSVPVPPKEACSMTRRIAAELAATGGYRLRGRDRWRAPAAGASLRGSRGVCPPRPKVPST